MVAVSDVLYIIGTVIVAIGVVFMVFGVIALLRFKNFYPRLLASSKIDTVGVITVIFGMILRHGLSPFSAKVALLGVIMLIFNPLVAHVLARSAYLSGYKLDEEGHDTTKKEDKA